MQFRSKNILFLFFFFLAIGSFVEANPDPKRGGKGKIKGKGIKKGKGGSKRCSGSNNYGYKEYVEPKVYVKPKVYGKYMIDNPMDAPEW
jgi:hypothetical protein